jgi:hypothetical protein
VFLAIYLTPSPYLHEQAYSTPTQFWVSPDLAPSLIGPAANATNVPLDTIIVIDQMRPMNVGELHLSPGVPIERRVDEHIPIASKCTTFYFSEPLKPATTYNVTLFFGDEPISWNFTTTTEPYYPRYEAFPSALGIFITVIISAVVTSVFGLKVWKKKKGELGR